MDLKETGRMNVGRISLSQYRMGDQLLWTRQYKYGMLWRGAEMLASKEGLCSTELFSYGVCLVEI